MKKIVALMAVLVVLVVFSIPVFAEENNAPVIVLNDQEINCESAVADWAPLCGKVLQGRWKSNREFGAYCRIAIGTCTAEETIIVYACGDSPPFIKADKVRLVAKTAKVLNIVGATTGNRFEFEPAGNAIKGKYIMQNARGTLIYQATFN